MNKLTTKQKKFIEAYDGNATQAAIDAGYSKKTAGVIGSENLEKPYIKQAIENRQIKETKPLIATRKDRQKFWTDVFNDPLCEMRDRLRASELLGKSEVDFADKVQNTHSFDYASVTQEEKDHLLRLAIEVVKKNGN